MINSYLIITRPILEFLNLNKYWHFLKVNMSYNYSHNSQYGQPPQYPSQQHPSQQYTAKHSSNPYMNNSFQQHQSSKVPETLFNPSPSPHKATLIRNQSFENRLYNEDLIQLIAKIRSLEDDLINEKFKN